MRNLQIAFLFLLFTTLSNSQVSYRPISGDGYSGSGNLPANGVADDYGPRCSGDYWHSELDFNGTLDDGDTDYTT